MHLLIASFMCYFLLLAEGNAEGGEGYQYEQNVPEIAENALLDAIDKVRRDSGVVGVGQIVKDERTFKDNWNDTLKEALKSNGNDKGMIKVAKKIGCKIELSTSEDGSHNVNLHCLLKNS